MKLLLLFSGLFLALLLQAVPLPAADGPCKPLKITTATLPEGVIGQPYSVRLLTAGGVPPIDWSLSRVGGSLPEGLSLSPQGLISGIPQAYGSARFLVIAKDSCARTASVARQDLTLRIASPATANLSITHLQLAFENGRPETTVKRNQPGLRVVATISFDGSGLLSGYWEVDGRLLASVNKHLVYGQSIQLTSPAIPFLPTFVEGSHRVRLVITNPALDITFPEAIYYVTGEESHAARAPIRLVSPRNHAEVSFAPQEFTWESVGLEVFYLIELFDKGDQDRISAAYTKLPAYNLPEAILQEKFRPGQAYRWQVKSYDADGRLISSSEPNDFIFQSPK